MIKISCNEAKELNKLGIKYGENGISHTHGHHKHYYLCESEYNLRCLLNISLNEKAEKLLKAIEERKEKQNKMYKKHK